VILLASLLPAAASLLPGAPTVIPEDEPATVITAPGRNSVDRMHSDPARRWATDALDLKDACRKNEV